MILEYTPNGVWFKTQESKVGVFVANTQWKKIDEYLRDKIEVLVLNEELEREGK